MLPTGNLAQVEQRPAVIHTPLGIVEFSVALGPDALSAQPDAVWRLANGAHLHRWERRGATVDLLLGPIEVPAWDGGAAVPTWAAVWQVAAGTGISGLMVAAELTGLPAEADGGADPGECLAAVTADTEQFTVSIGGPDDELLSMQAADGRLLPGDWVELLPTADAAGSGEYGVRYQDSLRIAWHLPGLVAPEAVRLCIATAWGPRDDERPAAWFAVDIPLDTAFSHLTAEPIGDEN
ncbi:hypothetical protein [Nocardia huaxiensis]|uniref:Uncharacterized protein n=1 Tax=Nocardia huaxiensis TaxID=2755382 RepID=A0A7D6VH55_9NOCA|nr:hypothetical protein [Nocardia huaxiensis]QLY32677.1 hypothetical protein H0264_10835 [Nocardia huaxiensis]UFS93589.1 hypothetical protein LPY97_22540 [Nocardia huaxiensis]